MDTTLGASAGFGSGGEDPPVIDTTSVEVERKADGKSQDATHQYQRMIRTYGAMTDSSCSCSCCLLLFVVF